MATLTIRMPDDKAERLKNLAAQRDISVNKMFEEWATMALTEFDTKAGFMARASRGSAKRGLELIATMNEREAAEANKTNAFHEKDQASYKGKDE